jgi:hypothetical protein
MHDYCLTHHDAISSTKTGINFQLSIGLDGIYLFDLHQLIADIEQIERVYDRNLPLSKDMARSLQAFGEGGRMIYLLRKHFLDGAKREITNARQRRGQRVWQ